MLRNALRGIVCTVQLAFQDHCAARCRTRPPPRRPTTRAGSRRCQPSQARDGSLSAGGVPDQSGNRPKCVEHEPASAAQRRGKLGKEAGGKLAIRDGGKRRTDAGARAESRAKGGKSLCQSGALHGRAVGFEQDYRAAGRHAQDDHGYFQGGAQGQGRHLGARTGAADPRIRAISADDAPISPTRSSTC
jgi:hypothetical protein